MANCSVPFLRLFLEKHLVAKDYKNVAAFVGKKKKKKKKIKPD